jgi:hypothetical protein
MSLNREHIIEAIKTYFINNNLEYCSRIKAFIVENDIYILESNMTNIITDFRFL